MIYRIILIFEKVATSDEKKMVLSIYKLRENRRGSFDGWTSFINPDILAEAGFYCVFASQDLVKCIFCGCLISGWRAGDDVWKEHARTVPNCIHVICCMGKDVIERVLTAEVPSTCQQVKPILKGLEYDSSKDINEDTYERHQAGDVRLYREKEPFILRQHGAHGLSTGACHPYVTNAGIRFAEPLHPNKCDINVRKETMNKVLQHLAINPDIVKVAAASGFYFEESQGQIICYYCGRPYNTGWKSSDDHWSHGGVKPYCFHCIMTKGEQFVIQNYNGISKEDNTTSPIMQGAANQRMKRKREDGNIEGWSDNKHSKRS